MRKLATCTAILTLTFSLLLFGTTPAQAGPDADALGHCLINSATQADKLALVSWMFTAMSMHPAVAQLAEVGEDDRRASLQGMANIMTVLLTERCATEARTAIRNEGPIAMQTSFASLGQVAATELFAHPQVAQGLAELESYMDYDAMNEALDLR